MWNPLRFLTRNFSVSNMWLVRLGQPQYPNMRIENAVKHGYVASGWVYRAIFLLQQAAATPTWGVYNDDGEKIDNHPMNELLAFPHPYISRKEFWKLLTAWMNLAGNGYLKKVKVGQKTLELWPMSPDRIAPIPGQTLDEWIAGFAIDGKKKVEYEPDEIIHMKFTNPANPLIGIAPLEAAARSVGVDVDQQDWNKSAMQNRGVVEGVFAFKEKFASQPEADLVQKKLNERYAGKSNARRIGVVGGDAKYYRTGMTAVEMDYLNSRKFNREEIFIIFGIPPAYAGVMDRATFNNYNTSELVFWFSTVIPYLSDIGDQMTFSLRDELKPGEKILPDVSDVPAVRRAVADKAKTAQTFHDMGVPFKQINRTFNLGFEEFEGWEESMPKNQQLEEASKADENADGQRGQIIQLQSPIFQIGSNDPEQRAIRLDPIPAPEERRRKYHLVEQRAGDIGEAMAQAREEALEEDVAPRIQSYLDSLRDDIFKNLEEARGEDTVLIIGNHREELEALLRAIWIEYGVVLGKEIILERQDITNDLEESIKNALDAEHIIQTEAAAIDQTTSSLILDQIEDALATGADMASIQQAIYDVGIFDPVRALRIGRTSLGSASSLGQLHAALLSGATRKVWQTARFEVRDAHQERQGEEVDINGRFSAKFGMAKGPRYPLDPELVPADRVNCRCSMSFR